MHSPYTFAKAFKVYFVLPVPVLDCFLRPKIWQCLLLVNEELHHCPHYLHDGVLSLSCTDTLVEVYIHELRACDNWLTIRLTITMTLLKDICCSIGQYASRRHLHSTGLQLCCSHAVHLDHRNICTRSHTEAANDSSTLKTSEDVASEWFKPQARACYHDW